MNVQLTAAFRRFPKSDILKCVTRVGARNRSAPSPTMGETIPPAEVSRFETLNCGRLSRTTSENSPSPIGWERAGVRVHAEASKNHGIRHL